MAQHLTATRPHLVERLVLSGTSHPLPSWLIRLNALNQWVISFIGLEHAAKLMAREFRISSEYILSELRTLHPKALECITYYDSFQVPMNRTHPTLVLVGSKETLFAKRAARHLAQRIPMARFCLVERVGHIWNLEKPEVFNEYLRAFLLDHPLPPC